MSHDTERANAVNLRAQVAILRSQLAESQARECQMQGILERVMVDRYWQQRIAFAKRGMGTAVEYGKLPLDIESTLTSSSGSCPHATRLAELEADAALDKAELSRIRPKRGDPYFHSTVEEWAAECRQTADLRAELAAVTKDRDELSALIEKQHSRVIKAIRVWRKAHPGNELTWPDLGALIEWLIERAEGARGAK